MTKLDKFSNSMLDAKELTQSACKSLQSANRIGTALSSLVLLPMIARAAALQADISALIDALNATE